MYLQMTKLKFLSWVYLEKSQKFPRNSNTSYGFICVLEECKNVIPSNLRFFTGKSGDPAILSIVEEIGT